MEKTTADFKGHTGTDANLETSLFEYGLIWIKGAEGHEKDFHFVYGVGVHETDNGIEYNTFDWADVPIDTDPEKEWHFVDWAAVCSFVGMEKADFLSQPLPMIVCDLISYYGHENVFGSSYYPFEISEA
jgi:hypothetical protein